MKVRALLEETRALIASPAHWTKGTFARDADGRVCGVHDENAVSFCLMGALDRCLDQHNTVNRTELRKEARRLLETATRNASLAAFNDTHSHADVLARLDVAIERAPA